LIDAVRSDLLTASLLKNLKNKEMKALFYWTCEGSVCHPEEALAKYGEIVRKYGNAGIQIKVLHSDDGCRTVYHRETSLLP
jgi:hypothetical protein